MILALVHCGLTLALLATADPTDRGSASDPPASQPAAATGTPAATQPVASAPAAAKTGSAARIEGILDELEAAGRDVRTVRCQVRYKIDDRLNITSTTKPGWIMFKRAETSPMFLIHFENTWSDGIEVGGKEWWLFRDRWLWEAKSKSQTVIKREVLRPGEQPDFFDIEKAPFPIPFGQRKDRILENFDVALVDRQVGDPDECDHLVCRPKPGARLAEEYSRLDFWVARDLHLPRRIVAEERNGDKVMTADFPKLSRDDLNREVADRDFELPAEAKGYHVNEEKLPADEPPTNP